jgi:hypothetical protein
MPDMCMPDMCMPDMCMPDMCMPDALRLQRCAKTAAGAINALDAYIQCGCEHKWSRQPSLTRLHAQVVTTTITNGVPDTALELVQGGDRVLFGEGLSLAEQEYIGAAINRHLERVSGPVGVENDLYPSTQARIQTSDSAFGHNSFDRRSGARPRPLDDWDDIDDFRGRSGRW